MTQRLMRLSDLALNETLRVSCQCGRITDYMNGYLQKHHGVGDHVEIASLRFRCTQCRRTDGFTLDLYDERQRGITEDKTIVLNPIMTPQEALPSGAEE